MTEPVNGCVRECVIYAVVGWINLIASALIFCTKVMKDKINFPSAAVINATIISSSQSNFKRVQLSPIEPVCCHNGT